MTPSFPRAPIAALALTAATVFAAGVAQAQGTDAQREACTPDAFRLCQKTIPDVDKTTACMKAHYAQLSPRCKVAFNEETGGPAEPRREAVAPPPGEGAAPREPSDTEVVEAPSATPGVEGYAVQIRRYCHEGLIDPFTCRNTLATLRDAE